MLSIKKIYTENPFIDMLLYYVKLLSYGCIIKDEHAANNGEQLDSLKEAELYIYAIEDGAEFSMYKYTEDMIASVLTPDDMFHLPLYTKYNSYIPEKYHDKLVALSRQNVIDTYEDKNNYYRKICGLPNYKDKGIPFAPYNYLLPKGETVDIAYVHEIGADGAKMLEKTGIIDAIKVDYPDADYLDYMSAGISIYKARKCIDKQILYMPSCGNDSIDDLFKEKYELVRDYVMKCVDSSAMEYGSENYQGFLCAFIFFLTILDIITDVQDHIIRKDILDARCIEYIFDTYGVPYYKNIPIKFQITLCKNINSIVQYKSSPTDMFKFITYFGAKSINIFKYYLLRDRKSDIWGEYTFTEKTEITSEYNDDEVIHETRNVSAGNYTIPFPFEYFLNKGNKMYVWVDDIKLIERVDYSVYNYDKIKFINSVYGGKAIRYEFYYDAETANADFIPNTKDGITTKMQLFEASEERGRTIQLELPYADYLLDGNELMLVISGSIVPEDAYSVDTASNTLTLTVKGYTFVSREINVIYFYGHNLSNRITISEVEATEDGQTVFHVPEPFRDYILNQNNYFVSIGTTFIDPSRYTYSGTDKTITFKNMSVAEGRSVTFIFIYSTVAIYNDIELTTDSQTLTADTYYQYTFTIDNKFTKFINTGYRVFVYLRGWYLDLSFFDVYGNTLTLKDRTISLMPKEQMVISCIHGQIADNCVVKVETICAQTKRQSSFTLTYPVDNFFERGNKIIIDSAGYPLDESKYSINGDILTITDVDHCPYIRERIGIQYVHNVVSEAFINITQQEFTATGAVNEAFYLNLPFYPYFETLHGILVFHNSMLVGESHITISKYIMTLDIDIAKGDQIMVLYIFNNKYLTERNTRLIVEEKTVAGVDDEGILQVPVPFDDYIEHTWPFFIDTAKKWYDVNRVDIINNGMCFIYPSDITTYPSYTFTFIYKKNCVIRKTSEDFDKDIDMVFLKLPLEALVDTDKYVKLKKEVKKYDAMTRSDPFWDGADPSTEEFVTMHEAIRKTIISKEFNYARTKYMSVNSIKNVAEMSFQIPYFYNMLYDDVFTEELLTVKIPMISAYHDFKLSHIFCYMTALAYIFNGLEDKLMKNPTKILLVKGFNFKASLSELKQWIIDQRRLPSDYSDTFSFMISSGQYADISAFVEAYRANKNVYKAIRKGMSNARNYDIYSIWKKMYDSLMVWQFNMEFFKLDNGEVADTFTEFLKEKEPLLYTSLIDIGEIEDKDSKTEAIITMIQDIIYILDEYLDSDEFSYIYNGFPGVSQDYLLEYLFTIINFFKSYKVMIHDMSTDLYFTDPDANLIRPNDVIDIASNLNKLDFITINESKTVSEHDVKVDAITDRIKEKINFKITIS